MTEMHAANLLWRMENMDDRARRSADERAGLLAHMLRGAGGSGGTVRRVWRGAKAAPAVS